MKLRMGEIEREDVSYLDNLLLDENNLLRPVPTKLLNSIPQNHLLLWGTDHAVWQFPTIELIDWLKVQIGGRKALEICAGNGAIGRALGVTSTDNRSQSRPYVQRNMQAIYGAAILESATTNPPKDVKKFEAVEAIRIFRPQIVFGCFVTPKGRREDAAKGIMCNAYGPDMKELLSRVPVFIHFGNKATHFENPIYKIPHEEYKFDWLFTKTFDPSLNRVWIWKHK